MGISALTPPPRPEDLHETLLEFADNRLLIDLCGEFDRNLAQIEHQLGVHILRRGNQVAVVGPSEARARAANVLTNLYARLQTGRPIDAGEIDGAIRMGEGGRLDPPSLDEQLEMFAGGRYEIRTRKKQVEPRTEAQKAYVKNLFSNELAFGIGPAGTGKTWLAVAHAAQLFERKEVDRIILTRPAVEAGERLGFLPGDMRETLGRIVNVAQGGLVVYGSIFGGIAGIRVGAVGDEGRTRQVDALCNELGITVPVAIHADHYGIKKPADVPVAAVEIPTIFEAGITSIAIDASHMPDADNLLASIELAKYIPGWAGLETEVGEIKGKAID